MPAKPSSWSKFPTEEEPFRQYKYGSINFFLSADKEVTERQTYSFLEWASDIGGLFDAMRYMGMLLIGPFVSFTQKAKLLRFLFRFVPSLSFMQKKDLAMQQSSEGKDERLHWDVNRA